MAYLTWTKNLAHERVGLSMTLAAQWRFLSWQNHSHQGACTLASPVTGTVSGQSLGLQILTNIVSMFLYRTTTHVPLQTSLNSHWCCNHFYNLVFQVSDGWLPTLYRIYQKLCEIRPITVLKNSFMCIMTTPEQRPLATESTSVKVTNS